MGKLWSNHARTSKKLILLTPISCLILLLCITIVSAAPIYIDSYPDFPHYPYNTLAYMQGGAYVGCGPTTGAMILAYFEHHFGATGLLKNPGVGDDEGLETAWELHAENYMNTSDTGFGHVLDIKPGLEDYAHDRGHQIKVMAHGSTDQDPATSWLNDYGAYGDAWMNDGDFWVDLGGGVWDIDSDKFCDFVGAKLSSGICIMLTVDSDGDGSGDHWIPCYGVDKDTGEYYYYNTYGITLYSADINSVGAQQPPAMYAISFVRSIEYIGPIQVGVDIESSDSLGNKKDTFDLSDTVYVFGSNYGINQDYTIYVVADTSWTDGMAIPAMPSFAPTVTSDASGDIPVTPLWTPPLIPGKYDIIVDVNGNGVYDNNVDALDDNDIQVTAGFFVIPEYLFGTILSLAACFAAFGILRFKRTK